MKRVLLFLASFLIGIYLFLPYDVLYSRALETLTRGSSVPLEYELSDASALKVVFSNVSIGRGKETLTLDDVVLRVTPLGYIFKGSLGYITTAGARVQVLKKDGLLDLVFDIKNFHNKILGDGTLTLKGHILVGQDQVKDGKIELLVKNFKVPAPGSDILLKEVSGSGDIDNGKLLIKDLTIKGPMDLSATGTVLLNYRTPEMSILDISVKYKMGALQGSQKLKGTVKSALASMNTLSALPA
ncbi:MAG: hypothetical protein GXO95_05115, partial [Nitrospirae bacterium]|nr:hypothetical protein [Nitrospirota bacterium]